MRKAKTKNKLPERLSKDDADIRVIIEKWAKAVREENREGIRADPDSEIWMFDVPGPLLSRGLDAYMATWEKFLSWFAKPIGLTFET